MLLIPYSANIYLSLQEHLEVQAGVLALGSCKQGAMLDFWEEGSAERSKFRVAGSTGRSPCGLVNS